MSLDITRRNLGWTFLAFLLLLSLFWTRSVLEPVGVTASVTGQLPVGLLLDGLAAGYPALCIVLELFCILACGMFLSRIASRNMILMEKIYLPFQIFPLIAYGSFADPGQPALFILPLMLTFACERMLESFRRVRLYAITFNGAFLLGCMSLIHALGAVSLLVLAAALILLRKRWREWIVALAGFFFPLLLASYIGWALDYPFLYLFEALIRGIGAALTVPGNFIRAWNDPVLLAFWGITVLLTLWALGGFFLSTVRIRTRPHKSVAFLTWVLLMLVLLLLIPGRSVIVFPLLAVPLSVVLPLFFSRQPVKITNAAYLLLVGSAVVYNLYPILLPYLLP